MTCNKTKIPIQVYINFPFCIAKQDKKAYVNLGCNSIIAIYNNICTFHTSD